MECLPSYNTKSISKHRDRPPNCCSAPTVTKVEQKTTATNNELSRGGGFFNQKVCKILRYRKDDDSNVIPENQRVCAEYEVQTPGQQLSQLTSDVLNDPSKQLQNVQKISQVILTVLRKDF